MRVDLACCYKLKRLMGIIQYENNEAGIEFYFGTSALKVLLDCLTCMYIKIEKL